MDRPGRVARPIIRERLVWENYIRSWRTSRKHKWRVPDSIPRDSASNVSQNRLLHMIRQQQAQIQLLQQQSGSSAIEDVTTPPESSRSQTPAQTSIPGLPAVPSRSHIPGMSRQSSHRSSDVNSHEPSPSIRPVSGGHAIDEFGPLGSSVRDESAFYQAETQTLTRENQMLKLRIRELGMATQIYALGPTNPY
jgi:hypothetical protein